MSHYSTAQRGITLLEISLAIAIVGLTIAMGIPSFNTMSKNSRIVAQSNYIRSAIAFARSEAAKRPNTAITICASSDVTNTATAVCSASNNWENGFLIFTDVNTNGQIDRAAPANEVLIRVGERLANGNTMRAYGFDNQTFVTFTSTGEIASSGTFVICDDRGPAKAKGTVITVAGQARKAADDDGDGIIDTHDGANVTCP